MGKTTVSDVLGPQRSVLDPAAHSHFYTFHKFTWVSLMSSTTDLQAPADILLGGRTAWSSTVQVNGSTYQARYWYDGTFSNNAMEDAAEGALIRLGMVAGPSTRR